MINNLPNNSIIGREKDIPKKEENKPARIVPPAQKKKRNPVIQFFKDFLPDDIPKTRDEIRKNIIIPTIAQTVVGCIARFLGTPGNRIGLPGNIVQTATRQFTSYGQSYGQIHTNKKETISQMKATISNYDELCWESAADVESLINAMKDTIMTKGYVTIADLYYMGTDIVPPFTDGKWGWVDLRNAHPIRVSNGYGIDLPKAMPIDEE